MHYLRVTQGLNRSWMMLLVLLRGKKRSLNSSCLYLLVERGNGATSGWFLRGICLCNLPNNIHGIVYYWSDFLHVWHNVWKDKQAERWKEVMVCLRLEMFSRSRPILNHELLQGTWRDISKCVIIAVLFWPQALLPIFWSLNLESGPIDSFFLNTFLSRQKDLQKAFIGFKM